MPLSPDQQREFLNATKGSASALLEDLQHLRELISKIDQSRGEIRRASAILRRLLVEGTLAAIASPRIGRVMLSAPDNKPIYKAVTPDAVEYVLSGGTILFGIVLRAAMGAFRPVHFKEFDPDRVVQLRIDTFLTQRVIFWKGKWVSRADVIKYVANIAEGVHSGAPQEEEEKLLADARQHLVIGIRGPDGVGIAVRPAGKDYDEKALNFSAASIDMTLVEMFAAARYLVESPSVLSLEAVIRKEFGGT